MKRLLLWTCLGVCWLSASAVHAAGVITITNYFPTYVLVQGTNDNVGTTGLATGTVYICIAASDLSGVNTTNGAASGAGSDVRTLTFSIVDRVYSTYDALASSNRSARQILERTQTATTPTNLVVKHTISTTRTLGTTTVTGE